MLEEKYQFEVGYGRCCWEGSDVEQAEVDWLHKSRRIPASVKYRIPKKGEIYPKPLLGERVVFVAHFQRGFALLASTFFAVFLTTSAFNLIIFLLTASCFPLPS
jgi:hypothetical protein